MGEKNLRVEITRHARIQSGDRADDLELVQTMLEEFPADWRLSGSGNIDILYLSKRSPLFITAVQSLVSTNMETGVDVTSVSLITAHVFGSVHNKDRSTIKGGLMSRNGLLSYFKAMVSKFAREKWAEKLKNWSSFSYIYAPNVVMFEDCRVFIRQGEWKKRLLRDEITYTPLHPVEIVDGKVKIGPRAGYLEYGPQRIELIKDELKKCIRGKSFWALENAA